jgi:OHCU decarboxylase
VLYAEGLAGAPKMLSIGLHCRLVGRPGRAAALKRALDYMGAHEGVWFATRLEIAEHWAATHPPGASARPSEMDREAFVAAFGGIYEHSPWIAEGAFALELGPTHDTARGVHSALTRVFRSASEAERLGVSEGPPRSCGQACGGEAADGGEHAEQASAGLDALTDEERAAFTELNESYTAKFGFPFIIAVRDHDKAGILAAFRRRIEHPREAEFAEACRQVERIAELRLMEKLG